MLGREIRVKPLFLTHSPQHKLLRVSGELHQILLVEKPYQTGLGQKDWQSIMAAFGVKLDEVITSESS